MPIGSSIAGAKTLFFDNIRLRLQRTQLQLNHDYRRAIVLAGTGRSGTTWAAEFINYDNRYRDMFEPFHRLYAPVAQGFFYGLYLRPENRNAEYLGPARRILSGRAFNHYSDRFNKRHVSSRRLVKEVRANLWLKWLKANFPEVPIIWLIRHPCAVASSRIKLDWPSRLGLFLCQQELIADHLAPYLDHIKNARTAFERHLYVWCIQHFVPLRQLHTGEVHPVFYEDLCVNPRAEVADMFRFLRLPYRDAIFRSLEKPSSMSRGDSAVVKGKSASVVDAWRKYVTPAEARRAKEILSIFGLDAIYTEDSMPSSSAARAMLASNKSKVESC